MQQHQQLPPMQQQTLATISNMDPNIKNQLKTEFQQLFLEVDKSMFMKIITSKHTNITDEQIDGIFNEMIKDLNINKSTNPYDTPYNILQDYYRSIQYEKEYEFFEKIFRETEFISEASFRIMLQNINPGQNPKYYNDATEYIRQLFITNLGMDLKSNISQIQAYIKHTSTRPYPIRPPNNIPSSRSPLINIRHIMLDQDVINKSKQILEIERNRELQTQETAIKSQREREAQKQQALEAQKQREREAQKQQALEAQQAHQDKMDDLAFSYFEKMRQHEPHSKNRKEIARLDDKINKEALIHLLQQTNINDQGKLIDDINSRKSDTIYKALNTIWNHIHVHQKNATKPESNIGKFNVRKLAESDSNPHLQQKRLSGEERERIQQLEREGREEMKKQQELEAQEVQRKQQEAEQKARQALQMQEYTLGLLNSFTNGIIENLKLAYPDPPPYIIYDKIIEHESANDIASLKNIIIDNSIDENYFLDIVFDYINQTNVKSSKTDNDNIRKLIYTTIQDYWDDNKRDEYLRKYPTVNDIIAEQAQIKQQNIQQLQNAKVLQARDSIKQSILKDLSSQKFEDQINTFMTYIEKLTNSPDTKDKLDIDKEFDTLLTIIKNSNRELQSAVNIAKGKFLFKEDLKKRFSSKLDKFLNRNSQQIRPLLG